MYNKRKFTANKNDEISFNDMRQAVLRLADSQGWDYSISQTGELIPSLCPICSGGDNSDRRSFGINLTTGLSCCKRGSCGWEGNFSGLQKKLGMDASEVIEVSNTFTKSVMKELKRKAFVKPEIKLLPPTKEIINYFAGRKISEATMKAFDISTSDGFHSGEIVFPFYIDEKKELIFVKYRKPQKWFKGCGWDKETREANTMSILFGMHNCEFGKPLTITEGQCFPANAEILTENGWVEFQNYDGAAKVMSVNESLAGEFVTPLAIVKKKFNGGLVSYRIKGNYSSITTPDHNIVYRNNNGRIRKQNSSNPIKNSNWNIPTVILHEGVGIPLSDDEIALWIAVSADGTIDIRKSGDRYTRFSVKKERKYIRMKGILDRLGIDYYDGNPNNNLRGMYYVGFKTPTYIQKLLPITWAINGTLEQKEFILNELVHWDGNFVHDRRQTEYVSAIYSNALTVQTIAHTCGIMSTVMTRPAYRDIGHGYISPIETYKVSILNGKSHVSTQAGKRAIEQYDGFVYCVTVPSGMILVRQEGHITVSGNCDAMSLYEAGIRNVVSVPSGAMDFNWIEHCWDWLEKFPEIIIFGDNDEPGQEMVENLLRRLSGFTCRVVNDFPMRPDGVTSCKDANEVLYFHGDLAIWDMLDSAEGTPLKGVINLADVIPIDPTTVQRIKTNLPTVDKTIGGIQDGTVTIFTGLSGSGKSTVTGQLILSAIEQGEKACIYSGELGSEDVQAWLNFQAAGSEYITLKYDPIAGTDVPFLSPQIQTRIRDWYNGKLYLFDDAQFENESQLESILSVFKMMARRIGAKLFLVDNVLTVTAEDDEEFRAQGKLIVALKHFAKKYGVAVLVVAHPRKKSNNGINSTIVQDDVGGNGALVRLADNVIVVERPDLRIIKNRKTGVNTLIKCVYCPDSRRIYEKSVGDRSVFSWNKDGIELPAVRADSIDEFREYFIADNAPF